MGWLPEVVVTAVIVVFVFIPHVVFRDQKEKKTKVDEEKEICVRARCGAETAYSRDTPIDRRNYYVDSVGQLCDKCGEELLDDDEYRRKKDNFLKALETT